MSNMQTLTVQAQRRSTSEAVVDAIADAEGADPLNLDHRLQDVVDGDALDRLTNGRPGSDGGVVVQFSMCGHDVAVHDDGRLYVDAALVENFHD